MLLDSEREIVTKAISKAGSLKEAYEHSQETQKVLSYNFTSLQKKQIRFPDDGEIFQQAVRAEAALQNCEYKLKLLRLALTEKSNSK